MRVAVVQVGVMALCLSTVGPARAQSLLPGGTDIGNIQNAYNTIVSAAVNQAMFEWEEACKNKDAAAVSLLYLKDAPILAGPDDVIRGREAIRELFANNLPRLGNVRLLVYDIFASGQLAYVSGNLSYAVALPGGGDYQVKVPISLALRQLWDNRWYIEAQTGGRLPPVFESVSGFKPGASAGTGDTIVVRLVDAAGRGMPGEAVWFEALTSGTSVTPTVARTDSTGRAVAYAALSDQPKLQVFRARAAALAEEPVSFSVVPSGGTAESAAKVDGDDSLRVEVTDRHGNPVSGIPVSFLLTGEAGSVLLDSMQTNHAGLASTAVLKAEQAGTNAIEARVLGVQPAIFTITRVPRSGTHSPAPLHR